MGTGRDDDIDVDLDDKENAAGAERRQAVRESIKLGVRFTTAQELARAVHASTKNIGMGGLCLLTRKSYEAGTPLSVTIELGGGETMQVAATVAWSRPGKAIGVRFMELDDAQRERLARLVGKAHEPEQHEELERAVDQAAAGNGPAGDSKD
jgi:uncharacterized protein (TIGR02266 family)